MLASKPDIERTEPTRRLGNGMKVAVQNWIHRHLIADDPYDLEAWNATLLMTQKALNTEHFPKELH